LTDNRKNNIADIPKACGFGGPGREPVDSACPVTKYRPDFIPSQLLADAAIGKYPTGIQHCVGCELCSPNGTSFAKCADNIIAASGIHEGVVSRAFGGALDAIVDLQLKNSNRQKRLDWITRDIAIAGANESGEVALFVGNAPYLDALLEGIIDFRPTDEVRAAVDLLNSVGVRPVVLADEVSTGGDRLRAGDVEAFTALGTRNRDLLKDRGVKTIVTACDDIRYTLANRYPGRIPGWNFKIVRLADFLVQRGGSLAFMPAREIVAIQPPDKYSDPDGLNSVHKLLSKVPELVVKEIEPGHPSTFGTWGHFDAVSKKMETDFLKAAEVTGAETVLIPSLRTLVKLLEGRRPGSWEETSIKIKGLYSFLSHCHTVTEDFAGA